MSDENGNPLGLMLQLCDLPVPVTDSPDDWRVFAEQRQELLDRIAGNLPAAGVSEEVLSLLREQCNAVLEAMTVLEGEHKRLGDELEKLRHVRSRLQGSILQSKPFRGNLDVTA